MALHAYTLTLHAVKAKSTPCSFKMCANIDILIYRRCVFLINLHLLLHRTDYMRIYKTLLACACVATVMLTGESCRNHNEESQFEGSKSFVFTCVLGNGVKGKYAKLYSYNSAYGKLALVDSVNSNRGVFSFSGTLDEPRVGVLEIDNKNLSAEFVLEPGCTELRIYKNRIVFVGGEQNLSYADFLIKYKDLLQQHKDLKRDYAKALCDSTMTRKKDLAIAGRDSVLQDSAQNLIVANIQKNMAFSRIIKDRYLNRLDSAHVLKLK